MASGEDKPLSLEEKLNLIDQEIRTLHEFCTSGGFDPYKVEICAKPVLDMVSAAKKKRVLNYLGIIAAVLAVLIGFTYVQPVYKVATGYAKRAAISVLPYWDWSRLYAQECMIVNPYFTVQKLQQEDCYLCEDLEKIDELTDVNHAEFIENYLDLDIPVIVSDAMTDWPANENFDLQFLHQLYSNEETLNELMPCMFQSNVRAKFNDLKLILKKGSSGVISNFYAHWENCETNAAKTLRQFYRRPYFLPPMVEMAKSNWIFVASHYKGKKNKPADIGLPLMLLAQIRGESKIILTPKTPCENSCLTLYAVLKEGQILAVTDMMWLLDYMPIGDAESIAVGMGGYFDYK